MTLAEPVYCARCVYPGMAVNLSLDDDGVCSACRTHEDFDAIPESVWAQRREKFATLVDEIRSKSDSDYDCIVPVSGGKDSYWQTHLMCEELGLKPLLVTYHGNNYLPEGDINRDRMRWVFDADHLVLGPSVSVLKKLNRLCFRVMGDMNWHAHCGIFTVPIQVAVRYRVPLVMWGEIAWDISGMYDPDDYVEFSARTRHEHALRGYEWDDLIGDPVEQLSEKDMLWARYPSDAEILDVGVRGLYVGNFYFWKPSEHAALMTELYDWKEAEQPFERTYRTMSNLDDRYENGIHDLMKFVKFGYGRASDHASKDIRSGFITREQGIEYVQRYDHVVSSDLGHWLDYVDMSEDEFWNTADGFRDPRIWWIEDGRWWKDTITGEPEPYGEPALSTDQQQKYVRHD